jgi:signal recognition particle GTPase
MSSSEQDPVSQKKPTVIITIGMAGSGKTTFMQVNQENMNCVILYFLEVER